MEPLETEFAASAQAAIGWLGPISQFSVTLVSSVSICDFFWNGTITSQNRPVIPVRLILKSLKGILGYFLVGYGYSGFKL